MKRLHFPFLSGKLGVSYTISAVIMTACTITLVIVASVYAYQVLEQQRGAAEFTAAKKSILAFNDAFENTAWKPKAVQSARFTLNYGQLELIPCTDPLVVNVSVAAFSTTVQYSTGLVRYYTKTKYANFGEGYKLYILGDESLLVTGSTESYGRGLIAQSWDCVNITLSYRVRAMRTSVITIDDTPVNYVDIWIIKVVIGAHSSYLGDFDLKAKCLNVTTYTPPECPVSVGDENCTVNVGFGSETPSSAPIALVAGKVVFNFVVAEVQVTI